MSAVGETIEVEVSETLLAFEQRTRSRYMDALRRGAIGALFGFLAISLVLLPDFLATLKDREMAEDMIFFLALLLVALLVGGAAALSRAARRERWVLDRGARELRLERFAFGRKVREEAIDVEHIQRFARSGKRVEARLQGAEMLSLVSARDASEADRFLHVIREFCLEHSVPVEVVIEAPAAQS